MSQLLYFLFIIIRNHAYEFISSIAYGNGLCRTVLPQDGSNAADSKISHIMPKGVIDIFQVICIHKHDSNWLIFLHALMEKRHGKLLVSHPVVESGERIMDVKLRKLFIHFTQGKSCIQGFHGSLECI